MLYFLYMNNSSSKTHTILLSLILIAVVGLLFLNLKNQDSRKTTNNEIHTVVQNTSVNNQKNYEYISVGSSAKLRYEKTQDNAMITTSFVPASAEALANTSTNTYRLGGVGTIMFGVASGDQWDSCKMPVISIFKKDPTGEVLGSVTTTTRKIGELYYMLDSSLHEPCYKGSVMISGTAESDWKARREEVRNIFQTMELAS